MLPSITVVRGPDGVLGHPPGAHAWWMGTARDELASALVDTEDAQGRARHAAAFAGASPAFRQELRAAAVALHEAHRHLVAARRLARAGLAGAAGPAGDAPDGALAEGG